MLLTHLVVWAWAPVALAAVATQASGHDVGTFGSLLVPGSAAASVIACVFLFLKRMEKAGEETSIMLRELMEAHGATVTKIMESEDERIRGITEGHKQSVEMLTAQIGANTESVREMTRWIRECGQHPSKGKPSTG